MTKKVEPSLKEQLDKEYRRAYINSFLSPEYDEHIPVVDESFFEKMYGKERYQKMKERLAERLSEI
ncbi:hypothetical protein [Algoriphagus formosus]|uniref:hypothetical protein n=1 Tax=Algoriphagus formosus TaxID=2007308 RepID=UPI000C291857|nr:hypothetical protein [Algoriphagus formosus]